MSQPAASGTRGSLQRSVTLGTFALVMIFLATFTHGTVRTVIITLLVAVAVVTGLDLLIHATPARVLAGDLARWWLRRRYQAWPFMGVEGTPPVWKLVVFLRHPAYPGNEEQAKGQASPLLPGDGLRCEIRRMWTRQKHLCTNVRPMGWGQVVADVPPELTEVAWGQRGRDPALRFVKGAYVARWRSNTTRRIARKTVWINATRYVPHPARRVLNRVARVVRHLRGLDDVDVSLG